MMSDNYWHELSHQTDKVYESHPSLNDAREGHPWLTGALGDPFAGIWFAAENPSLTQVERVSNPDGGEPTYEAQWWASRGDKLFREMLLKHGFKSGSIASPSGWHCYITNVIKEADYTKNWREKSQQARNGAAETWASVLAWELKTSNPRLVVVVGGQAQKLLNHLRSVGMVHLPRVERITHYAYIGQRPQGKLGPMHPQRVQAYDQEFANIRKIFDDLNK